MIDQWMFYLLAVPVVLLVGLSKGGFGGGLGSLAVPVLSLAVDPRLAAAVLLPILCSMDLVSLWSFRGKWDRRNLQIMFPAAIIGLAVGAASFTYMDADKIRFMVGLMALYFVGHYVWGRHILQQVAVQKASVVRGSFWSLLAGFVSYIAHAAARPSPFICCRSICRKPYLSAPPLCFSAWSITSSWFPMCGPGSWTSALFTPHSCSCPWRLSACDWGCGCTTECRTNGFTGCVMCCWPLPA